MYLRLPLPTQWLPLDDEPADWATTEFPHEHEPADSWAQSERLWDLSNHVD